MIRRSFLQSIAATIAGLSGLPGLALEPIKQFRRGRTCVYVGPGTDFSDPSNWSHRQVPVDGDSIVVKSGAKLDTVGNLGTIDTLTIEPGASVGFAKGQITTITFDARPEAKRVVV